MPPCPPTHRNRQGDLVEVIGEEEAAAAAALQAAAGDASDFGAKLSLLLAELGEMRRREPAAKAVIFSSWARWGACLPAGRPAGAVRLGCT